VNDINQPGLHVMTPSTTLPAPQPNWSWYLDLDGTLLDIAPSPLAVVVPDGLLATLSALRTAAHGALAVVSGRPVQQVRSLLEPLRPAAAGLHGLELVTPDGLRHGPKKPLPPVGNLRRMLQENVLGIPGVEFENKGATLAVHFRQAPQAEIQVRRIIDQAVAKNRGFEVLKGKMVFEIRPTGINKGTAIREFMAIPPFAGRVPVFAGDDTTDEDAFAVVAEAGGITLYVGEGDDTVAQWRVESPAALRLWLAEAAEALKRQM
jgi:trehalose 6-phosphate phosphatase